MRVEQEIKKKIYQVIPVEKLLFQVTHEHKYVISINNNIGSHGQCFELLYLKSSKQVLVNFCQILYR